MRDKDVNKFLRAAEQRLTSAEFLFQRGMYLDCMYIAGYCPECALKALILSRIPRHRRQVFARERFRGAVAHDFEYLKAIVKDVGVTVPLAESRRLGEIASWSTDLRYEVGLRKSEEAEAFLIAARAIRDWVRRSL